MDEVTKVKLKNRLIPLKAYLYTVLFCAIFSFFRGCGIGHHVGYSGEHYSVDAMLFGLFLSAFTIAPIVMLFMFAIVLISDPKKKDDEQQKP